jgi:hypothetical protein
VRWWKCMRVDLQSTKGAILLAERTHWEWWLVGVHYGNTKWQGFLSECEGFFIERCLWFPNEDFLWILRQGIRVCVYSAKIKFPSSFKNSKIRMHKSKENHRNTNAGIKISLRNSKHP